ncbi:MAG: GGDEF domain-containing protein [Micavibrio sp.]|nr:GGDEF domain-containing protein [Micavibrio sp.]
MQYSHSVEKANVYAAQAFEQIHELGLAPTPEIYELWYVYYSEINPEVIRAIDILVTNNQTITEERCRELHHRFLSEGRESERVREAGDRIHETIKGVTGAVTNVKSATSQYNMTLNDAKEKLSGDMSKETMERVLKDVMSDTENMMGQNKILEEQLTKSSAVMQELRRDLEMVRKEALTDGLTSLANRKAFDAEIERIAAEAKANGTTFSLIMMDIDHFKSFNDNFGHQVGDQVLRLVAMTLTEGVKGRDLPARYGGEEFAIIFPDTPLQGALKVGDILRKAVAGKEVINRANGEKLGRITLSGGVAEFVNGESVEDLIARADAALYTAKHNGRNQIAAAPAPRKRSST